ncbi:MAG: DUF1080 domain-containing protein, partial [Chitinophagaceae bacterium]|nr:DUF1080 domain-containing protein [Chitinophagaceae bacterium]
MRSTIFAGACVSLSLAGLVSCGDNASNTAVKPDSAFVASTDTSAPSAGNWVSLFDGKSLAGWHGFNKKGETVKNWDIEDSSLVCLGAAKDAHGGDIVSDGMYGNFELTWDWKVNKGSNSGVMYHVVEDPKYKAPYETGPEYQMIDDIGFPEKLQDWQKTGADYAMTVANDKKKLKPVGEWNSSRIVFNNGHVEHWLNGEKIVEFQAGTEDWNKKRTTGKWKDYPDYGKAKTGGIALQDHGNKVFFRNIR